MGKISKRLIAMLVIQSLILLSTQILVLAESLNDSNVNCVVSTISPVSNIAYNATMPLNVNMAWTVNTVVPFMYFNVSYCIDDSQKISIPQGNNPSFNSTAQGTALHFEYVVFPPSTTNTAINIDISKLTSGAHKLTIFADGEYNVNNDFIFPYHFQSSTIYFSVNYLAAYPVPSPSSPEFTAKFVASSIEVTIKNQPISAYVETNGKSPSLYYSFRFKDNNATIPDWNYAPVFYVGISSYGTYYKASGSDYNAVSFPLGNYPLTSILNSGRIDLQVMALIGNEVPTNYENGGIYGFDGSESIWSVTQTITIPNNSSSPTPTVPEFPALAILPLLIAIIPFIVVKLFRKRKCQETY